MSPQGILDEFRIGLAGDPFGEASKGESDDMQAKSVPADAGRRCGRRRGHACRASGAVPADTSGSRPGGGRRGCGDRPRRGCGEREHCGCGRKCGNDVGGFLHGGTINSGPLDLAGRIPAVSLTALFVGPALHILPVPPSHGKRFPLDRIGPTALGRGPMSLLSAAGLETLLRRQEEELARRQQGTDRNQDAGGRCRRA